MAARAVVSPGSQPSRSASASGTDGLQRVAVLMDTKIVSGPARQLAAIIPPLRAAGFDLRVITFHRKGEPASEHARFLSRLEIPHVVLQDSGRFDPALPARVSSVLAEWRPAIVQTHSYRPTVIAAWLALPKPSWRWIAFFHGTTAENRKVRFYHWLDRRLLRRANRVVVMAQSQRVLLEQAGITRIAVVGNANILQAVSAPSTPEYLARLTRASRPRLGVIGRLSPEKGVDLFLEALHLLQRRGQPFSASVIGDGPERESLLRQAASLGLADRVAFLGAQPVLPRTYQELDLLVIPSRSEGFPNVLLEALSEGCPVVAASVGGIPEVTGSSPAVTLVPPESPERLLDGILEAIRTPRSPTVAAAARELASSWGLERRVAAHVRLYQEVLGGAG